ncbi:hypothetical protein A9320_11005 [Ruegeria sp. PBVC088]|nr:hypothetical protein A9320_11005 [Ruegeria sp. PBVC088]
MSVGINMSFEEVRRHAASSIDVVVQLGQQNARREVEQIWVPEVVCSGPSGLAGISRKGWVRTSSIGETAISKPATGPFDGLSR